MAAEETLSYYIRAFDLATPVFRAFGGEVEATTRRVQGSLATMNREMAAQAAETKKLAEGQKVLAAEQDKGVVASGRAAGASRKLGTDVRGATTEIQKHKNAIEQAGYALSGFSSQLGPAGRSLDMAARHAQLFRSQGIDYIAAGLVGGAAAFAAYGLKAASTFDKLNSQIQQQAGVTHRVAGQLVADVEEVATKTPASYQQIADAVSAQYKLLHENATQIKANTDLFLAFSDKAGTQVVPTITQLHQVMKLFHPAGMGMVDVMDQLVNLSQRTQRPLGDYLSILSKYGPALQAMGLSFPQTIGMFDAFSKAGVSTASMGRGLTTVMTKAETAIKTANTAAQDGGAKLKGYGLAVDTAQISVNRINGELAAGKGNQQALNDQLTVAQGRLQIAKDKYGQYNKALHNNADAHKTVTEVVGKELSSIEDAKSKSDALNLSIQAFGGRLGPQMADALYHNKSALDAMQKSLGDAKGKTEDLAKAQRDTLSGQLKILEHDFTNIAATFGQDILPAFKEGVHLLTALATGVEQFSSGSTKGLAEVLAALGVGGGAVTLLARHTPLGAVTSNLPGPLGQILSRQKDQPQSGAAGLLSSATGGGLYGFMGDPKFVGSRANPLAVVPVGAGTLGMGPVAGATEREAVAAAEPGIPAAVTSAAPTARAAEGAAAAGIAPQAEVYDRTLAQGILGPLKSGLGSVLKGGLIAGGGMMASQLAGSVIGGKAGKDIGAIGTDASIGAGLGSLLGPEGTIAGGVLGGLVGGFKTFADQDANKYGDQIAAKATAGLPKAVADSYKQGIADAANKAHDLAQQAAFPSSGGAPGGPSSGDVRHGRGPNPQGSMFAHSDSQAAAVAAANEAAGKKAGEAWVKGEQTVKFPSTLQVFEGMRQELNALPPQFRNSATQLMLEWAKTMQSRGQLPQGALSNVIQLLKVQFPGLTLFAGQSAQQAAAQVASALHMKNAISNTQQAVSTLTTEFGNIFTGGKVSSDNLLTAVTTDYGNLRDSMGSMTKQGRVAAQAELDKFKQVGTSDAQALAGNVATQMAHIAASAEGGSSKARASIQTHFGTAVGDIQSAMAAGSVAVGQGMKIINQLLIQELGDLGVKVKPSLGLSNASLEGLLKGGNTTRSGPNPGNRALGGPVAASGIRVPGAVGGDSWTLLDPGGRPAAKVGGGELLVANRHTEAAASAATIAKYGKTLGQMVAGEMTPHSAPGYATGGVVTASDFGGPGDPGTGSSGYRGDNLYQHPDSYAELNMGTALGNLPYLTPLDVTYRNKTARLRKRDIGAGGAGLGGHPRAIDLWFEAAQGLGFSGLGLVQVNGPAGVNVQIAGGGGGVSVPTIRAPHVKGGGAVGSVAQAVLNRAASAANRQLQAAAASQGGGMAAGVGYGPHGFPGAAPIRKGEPPAVQTMIRFADRVASHDYPYAYGGGHDAGFTPPYDCSGSVSAVLHSAGLLGSPEASAEFTTYGDPGPGKYVTIYARGPDGPTGHVFMSIDGHYFGTSGMNPGGGANWIPSFPEPMPAIRHPPGLALGGEINLGSIPAAGRSKEQAHLRANPKAIIGGMAGGGRVGFAGAFGDGGGFTAHGPTLGLFGEKGIETVVAIPHAQLGGDFSSDFVKPGSYAPSSSSSHSGGKPSQGLNPLTGKVETHTPAEWKAIHLQAAVDRHASAEQKKKDAARLAEHVKDTLVVGSQSAGSLDLTRKAAASDKLPVGGTINMLGDFKDLTSTVWAKIVSALKGALATNTVTQSMDLANAMAAGIKRDHLGPKSRNDSLENIIIAAAAKGVAGAFAVQQKQFDTTSNVAQLIEAAPSGSTARSLGLTPIELKAMGITAGQVRALAGSTGADASGPGAYAAQVKTLTKTEIPKYQQDAKRLEQLYRDALVTHNTKLQQSLLSQIDTVTQATLKAYSDLETAQVNEIKAKAQAYSDQSTQIAGTSSLLTAIQQMAPGQSLSKLGLSPAVLKTLGISTKQATALQGTDLSYLQNVEQQQGGHLTASQLAGAKAGVAAQNALLVKQESPIEKELNYYQKELPRLKGQDQKDAITAMKTLAQQLASLQGSVNSNNDALTSLEQTVSANTAATTTSTGAMTGTVGYTYQNQNYVAGGLTSDSAANTPVGV